MLEKGWRFPTASDTDLPGENATPDPVSGHEKFTHLRDIYFSVEPNYSGRFTVPTLYDKKQHKIVSNESSEILRMMYHEFDDLVGEEYKKVDLLPKDLEGKIEEANEWTYNDINNGMSSTFAESRLFGRLLADVFCLRRCLQVWVCDVSHPLPSPALPVAVRAGC